MGCAKNTVDSEYLTGQLKLLGHEIFDEPSGCDVGIINTCGFIQDAVKENISAILDLEQLKADGVIKKFIVAGCLVNRYEKELRQEFPTADLFARSEEWDKIIKFLDNKIILNCERSFNALDKNFWTRYLKISEGCNTLCSYCAIPLIRGKLRSTPIKKLISEAQMLCSAGARELCLVGQDLTVYGQDFNDGTNLKKLISALSSEIPEDVKLRLLYLHPERVNEELINFLLENKKVLHYLDIPVQHCDPEILARMNRPLKNNNDLIKIFKYIRECDELFALRTTLMTGFPGEDENKFNALIDFISEIEFDRLGAFVYSPEEGTKAALFEDQINKDIAEFRCNKLMEVQAEISSGRNELFINRELKILVEEIDEEAGEIWGRSYRDAPEVDGMICANNPDNKKINLGDIVSVKILDSSENDLFGEII